MLKTLYYSKLFELASMRPGLFRATLTVLAVRRLARLAGTQISRAQTIPFNNQKL